MKYSICEKTGKRGYKRHQEAAKVVGYYHIRSSTGLARVPRQIYRCAFCSKWHVTSMTTDEFRNRNLNGVAVMT